MVNNAFINELDKYITIYGSISCFAKAKENNEIDLITPCNKLNFSIEKDVYEEETELELAKVSSQSTIHTASNTKHFGILSTNEINE